ncbi:MAG: SIP domain-containing protein [Cardiobacteriaceae bacterium]|nr:SIP domain-containing protein [Cardiobacteriaceae bacterium]
MTPLSDPQHKADILDHINDDHSEELLIITRAYGKADAKSARLIDIYQEGCLIDTGEGEPLYIPFQLKGDLEENILYLAYDAMVRAGKPLDASTKHYFTVQSRTMLTPRLLRLAVNSAGTLPDEPGYALCFVLKTLEKLPQNTPAARERLSFVMQWANRLFLLVMKHLSPARRQKIFDGMNKGKRYYSVRGKNADGHLLIDIYLHGESPGSLWAQSLKRGDIIHSIHDYREHTDHLAHGQTLLIADETALSTVAALLENWQNPVPPAVILITHHPEEQAYLSDDILPPGSALHRLAYHDSLTTELTALIDSLPAIDAAWGALENHAAKVVRHHLRQRYQLDGRHNRIKAYWKKS